MALPQPSGMTTTTTTTTSRLELPSLSQQSSMHPFYSSTTLSSSTSDLSNLININEPLSPRTLYAQSFDRPSSARSLPSSKRFRKNMKEMTGFGTTEEEFEALPIAVRIKVRGDIFITSNSSRSRAFCWPLRLHSKRVFGKLRVLPNKQVVEMLEAFSAASTPNAGLVMHILISIVIQSAVPTRGRERLVGHRRFPHTLSWR